MNSALKKPLRKINQHRIAMRNATINVYNSLAGSILNNKVTAYWDWGIKNFGDLLTPLLLRKYGFTPICTATNCAQLVSVGSVLGRFSTDYSGIILGSGLMNDRILHFTHAKIMGVRGKLTKERIGASGNIVLGDPGLLASRLLKKREAKRHTLGIVPHYKEKKDLRIKKLAKLYNNDIFLINVSKPPLKVIEDIDKCEYILSSSLHGLTVADSLGIPNRWIHLSDKIHGKGFKYYDYYSALALKPSVFHLSGDESLSTLLKETFVPNKEIIEQIKDDLHNMFNSLKEIL